VKHGLWSQVGQLLLSSFLIKAWFLAASTATLTFAITAASAAWIAVAKGKRLEDFSSSVFTGWSTAEAWAGWASFAAEFIAKVENLETASVVVPSAMDFVSWDLTAAAYWLEFNSSGYW
jgi:hypothetical protein